jgi:hypothetical protein
LEKIEKIFHIITMTHLSFSVNYGLPDPDLKDFDLSNAEERMYECLYFMSPTLPILKIIRFSRNIKCHLRKLEYYEILAAYFAFNSKGNEFIVNIAGNTTTLALCEWDAFTITNGLSGNSFMCMYISDKE